MGSFKPVSKFRIFPQPAKAELNIEMEGISGASVLLRDVYGKETKYTSKITGNIMNINVSTFARGVYILVIRARAGEFVERVVLE